MVSMHKSGLLLLSALLLAGCSGNGKLQARGKVMKGGAPLTAGADDFVKVTFFPVYADGRRADNTYIAQFDNADGRFTVLGPDGNGLPPGKYKVSIEHERKKKDLFKGAYNMEHTPFVFDVDASGKEIVIDLDEKS